MKYPFTLLFSLLAGFYQIQSQQIEIQKIEPPNWWVGMKWDTVQLMVYGENFESVEVSCQSQDVEILNVKVLENPSYLFIDMAIGNNAEPGEVELIFNRNENESRFYYHLYNRKISGNVHQGFTNEDIIYLIFADRFCDGDPLNNFIDDSLDQFASTDIDGRKGGDIEGIISKLDYLKSLGVTTIWITPMLENNMWMSYHGYAATDFYNIDLRFGSNQLYKKLVSETHNKGLKIILDHVSNHIGINHYWMKNIPSSDWFNGSVENHFTAFHDKIAFVDSYGDSSMIRFHQQGWFTNYMPDLNQRNQFLKNYLIQNTLWWIEFTGLDGIREDTYPYNDQKYLSEWAEAVLTEYPNFNIVGEIWQGTPSILSAYQKNSSVRKQEFDSNLPAITDFALSDAIRNYLSGKGNLYKVYETVAQDIVYSDPDNLVIFIDNHDMERAMLMADGNVNKFKVALNLMLFTRGIPVIFYGTELGIEGGKKHGELRQTFPGGFSGDRRNAFTADARTTEEQEIFLYLKKLITLRKEFPVLAKGKLTHFYPMDGVYVVQKKLNNDQAIIIFTGDELKNQVHTTQLKIFLPDKNRLRNLITGQIIDLNSYEVLDFGTNTAEIFIVEN